MPDKLIMLFASVWLPAHFFFSVEKNFVASCNELCPMTTNHFLVSWQTFNRLQGHTLTKYFVNLCFSTKSYDDYERKCKWTVVSLETLPDKTGPAKVDGGSAVDGARTCLRHYFRHPPLPPSLRLNTQPQSLTAHTLTRERGAKVFCLDIIESNINA